MPKSYPLPASGTGQKKKSAVTSVKHKAVSSLLGQMLSLDRWRDCCLPEIDGALCSWSPKEMGPCSSLPLHPLWHLLQKRNCPLSSQQRWFLKALSLKAIVRPTFHVQFPKSWASLSFSFYAVQGILWGLSPIDHCKMLEERLGPQTYPAETATPK